MNSYLAMPSEQSNSVKSQYHCATLVGNWEEERLGFGPPLTGRDANGNFNSTTLMQPPTSGGPALPIDPNTIYTVSYKAPTVAEMEAAKPPGCLAGEAPRELLFYHGDLAKPTEKNLLTIHEMSFTDGRTEAPYTNEEILDMHGVSSRKEMTASLRRSMGFAASSGRKGGRGSTDGRDDEEEEKSSAAIEKASAYIRSLVQPGDGEAASAPSGPSAAESASGYAAPRLLPFGRVAAHNALLTTKNVTIDATGEHLYTNLEAYPLTSSVCVGKMMASKNDPMHKTHLRVHEITK